jgi:radical SAM superfamily enzyme YgiQ (UPF0313 family)
MNILLLSMPDSFEHMPAIVIRMPNGALASLAGNVDPHHKVAIADLILVRTHVRSAIERLVNQFQPDVVGLSVMTFQRSTAFAIAGLIRRLRPTARIVAGGYDPSLAPESYQPCREIDFLIRGEGEHTFSALLRQIETGGPAQPIAGLSFRTPTGWVHGPNREIVSLAAQPLRLPNRRARVLEGYTLLGRPVDVVETSRGCTFDCSFCSIIEMRGRNFHAYPIEIFLVDDNITLDVHRFEALCEAIIAEGLNRVEYFVQAMTSPLAHHGARLAPLMRRAGFRYVFLGIENILDTDLDFLNARAKNSRREHGRTVGNATIDAITHLHRHGMFVVGGLIVGNPDDTRESIEANLAFARRYVDWPYIQHPTPYPRTPMTRQFRDEGLILDEDVAHYDGTTSVVKCRHVSPEEVERLRWRAERWIKLKHLPAAFLHSPLFVLRHCVSMMKHTFAGTTLKSAMGLEGDAAVFARFRRARRRERAAILPDNEAPVPH